MEQGSRGVSGGDGEEKFFLGDRIGRMRTEIVWEWKCWVRAVLGDVECAWCVAWEGFFCGGEEGRLLRGN